MDSASRPPSCSSSHMHALWRHVCTYGYRWEYGNKSWAGKSSEDDGVHVLHIHTILGVMMERDKIRRRKGKVCYAKAPSIVLRTLLMDSFH
jgi:hypothetical protein